MTSASAGRCRVNRHGTRVVPRSAATSHTSAARPSDSHTGSTPPAPNSRMPAGVTSSTSFITASAAAGSPESMSIEATRARRPGCSATECGGAAALVGVGADGLHHDAVVDTGGVELGQQLVDRAAVAPPVAGHAGGAGGEAGVVAAGDMGVGVDEHRQ